MRTVVCGVLSVGVVLCVRRGAELAREKKTKKKILFFFAGVDDGGFFLVVGVLIWTIPTILLLRSPPRWSGYFMQKTAYDFVCFWLK